MSGQRMCEDCGLDVFGCPCHEPPTRKQLAAEFSCCLVTFGAVAWIVGSAFAKALS